MKDARSSISEITADNKVAAEEKSQLTIPRPMAMYCGVNSVTHIDARLIQ